MLFSIAKLAIITYKTQHSTRVFSRHHPLFNKQCRLLQHCVYNKRHKQSRHKNTSHLPDTMSFFILLPTRDHLGIFFSVRRTGCISHSKKTSSTATPITHVTP